MVVSSLRKTGMSPFGQIFNALLQKPQSEIKLKQLNYFGILTNLLFNEKKIEDLPQP